MADDIPAAGRAASAVSGLQKFEGPDPAHWVPRGYAVEPDARRLPPEGDPVLRQRTGATARTSWSGLAPRAGATGARGLPATRGWPSRSGSWRRAPSTCAIAPWRDSRTSRRGRVRWCAAGGVHAATWPRATPARPRVDRGRGRLHVERPTGCLRQQGCQPEAITPAYVVASWTNNVHTHGRRGLVAHLIGGQVAARPQHAGVARLH